MIFRAAVIISVALVFGGCVRGGNAAASADEARIRRQCNLLTRLSEDTIRKYDQDGDGRLDRAEYGRWVAETERTTSMPIDADIGFKQLDRDSDGFIEVQDMARVPSREGGVPHAIPCR